jgi:hypothetical protein
MLDGGLVKGYNEWATEMYGTNYNTTWLNPATKNSTVTAAFFAALDNFTSDASEQGHLIAPNEAQALLDPQYDSYVSEARPQSAKTLVRCIQHGQHTFVGHRSPRLFSKAWCP